jgi:para-aminobenzoate synthetase component 1
VSRTPPILLEHGPGGRPAAFGAPAEVVSARAPEEVGPALARLDAARGAGAWVAGWIAYEAGAAFEPRLRGVAREDGQLLAFGVFPDGPREAAFGAPGPARLSRPEPLVARADYDRAIGRRAGYIAAGDAIR